MVNYTSSTHISCPDKCAREDCLVHRARWEPVGDRLVIVSSYTHCNHCGYERMELLVPKQFEVTRW